MSEDNKDIGSVDVTLYPDDSAPAVACAGCDHQFNSGEHFFRCFGCNSENGFNLCQSCCVKDDPSAERHALRPCILDHQDSRPTFLPRPSLTEFRRLLKEAELEPSRMFPLYFEDFAIPALRKPRVATVGVPHPAWKSENESGSQAIVNMVKNDYDQYARLDPEMKDIRLFKLARGSQNEPVAGFLARFSYPWDQVHWAALSYCWGDLSATRPIDVLHLDNRLHDGNKPSYRGQMFSVTANLEMALRNTRRPDEDLWLWVDALCINQGDPDERRLRFRRVWVLQEVWSARQDVFILVRRHMVLPWSHVLLANLFLAITMAVIQTGAVGEANVKGLVDPWEAISRADLPDASADPPYQPIQHLVSAVCKKFQASDDRDKIFALLAMGRETHELQTLPDLIKIDYRKPVAEVFTDFTRCCILQQGSLEVLGYVSFNARPVQAEGHPTRQLPSWALASQAKYASQTTVGSVAEFKAAGDTSLDLDLVQNHDQRSRLHLRGFRLSKVSQTNKMYFEVKWHISDELCFKDEETSTWYTGAVSCMWWSFVTPEGKATKSCSPVEGTGSCTCQLALDELLMLLTWGGFKQHGNCDHALGIHRPKWLAPKDMYADFAAYWVRQGEEQGDGDPNMDSFCPHVRLLLKSQVDKGTAKGFLQLLLTTAAQKSFFTTDDGRGGLCPPGTRVGDAVVAFSGGRAPCVLRPLPTEEADVKQWQFIGECYLHEGMDGRRVTALVEGSNTGEVFTLV